LQLAASFCLIVGQCCLRGWERAERKTIITLAMRESGAALQQVALASADSNDIGHPAATPTSSHSHCAAGLRGVAV